MRHSIRTIINRQISREKISRVSNPRIHIQGGDKKHSMNGCSAKTVLTSKSKVVILGNSHFKGSVPRIKGIVPRTDNHLGSKFEVSGFINPGAGFEKIVGKTNLGSSTLINKDVLVCNGGANVVYNSDSKTVKLQIM